MILHDSGKQLKFVPIDLLFIASTLYLGGGIYYGFTVLGNVYSEAVYSYLACIIGYLFFRNKAYKNAPIINDLELSAKVKEKLILLAIFGTLLMLISQLFFDGLFYSSDKIARSAVISSSFYIRIPFYAALFICFCLYATKDKSHQYGRFILFMVIGFVTLLDMNREFLIAYGIIFLIRHFNLHGWNLIPSGFWGFVIITTGALFVLLAAKPLYYLIMLGSIYDGGFANFGEAVNWYRWLDFANTRDIDLSIVQRNDLYYSLQALVYPFSSVDSASKIWFNEILGYEDVGRTFGYSGVLWLSYYFKGPLIMMPWLLIFWFYSLSFFRKELILKVLVTFGLALITYRFFRSEWPLVLKTFLWTFIYPGVVFLLLSRMVIRKSYVPFAPQRKV